MHIPVLLTDVLQFLDPKPNEHFIDGTVGEGGHAGAILERTGPKGRILGIDRDSEILQRAKTNLAGFGKRVTLACGPFSDLKALAAHDHFPKADGVLLDLGLSSFHLEESHRGFSFLKDEPLDMRFSPTETRMTAADIVNFKDAVSLEKLFRDFGEERFSRRIARAIVQQRTHSHFSTSRELALLIERVVPPYRARAHPATRIFQALRIAVNKELTHLEHALPQAIEIIRLSGRIVVISYHSLEDRIVKHFLRDETQQGRVTLLTRKPVFPQREEIVRNPRARSAKLRCAAKL